LGLSCDITIPLQFDDSQQPIAMTDSQQRKKPDSAVKQNPAVDKSLRQFIASH
jgi:hypothetical protein